MYTTESWVAKAATVHGHRYLYDKVNYKKSDQLVIITCKEHGAFEQKPSTHLRGSGCPKCAEVHKNSARDSRRLTTDIFIQKCVQAHGDTYDYTKTQFISSDKKVVVTCKVHGDFEQKPHTHINGSGCPKCRYLKSAKSNRRRNWDDSIKELDRQPLVLKVRGVLPDADIDFSCVEYVNNKTKIKLRCNKHNHYFWQKPNLLLNGHIGCPECVHENSCTFHKKFLELAHAKHGDRFEYSRAIITSPQEKVEIVCDVHGVFNQTPECHLRGTGCPKCYYESQANNLFMEYYRCHSNFSNLYILLLEGDEDSYIKVGVATKPKSRMADIERDSGLKATLLNCFNSNAPYIWEAEKHIHYKSNIPKKRAASWSWAGSGECYSLLHYPLILNILSRHLG